MKKRLRKKLNRAYGMFSLNFGENPNEFDSGYVLEKLDEQGLVAKLAFVYSDNGGGDRVFGLIIHRAEKYDISKNLIAFVKEVLNDAGPEDIWWSNYRVDPDSCQYIFTKEEETAMEGIKEELSKCLKQ